ncbi:MAG TPA: hypothetical protein VMG13_26560 [Trebonia sp.]|nr:hypothetical protein [Trebonia sp.]
MPTEVRTPQEKTREKTGIAAFVWSSVRAGLFLAAAIVFFLLGNHYGPGSEPQLPVSNPAVTVLTNDSAFTGSVNMSLSASGKLYSLKLTITPATAVPADTTVRVTFGKVPVPIPNLVSGSFSSPQGGQQYYELASPSAGRRTYSATYTAGQQIGESASGGQLRVAFPSFTGETPGKQYSAPACSPQGSLAAPQYAALCASLGSTSAQWSVPVLQAGQSTLTSGGSGLADYQYLAGDAPTLLGDSGWTWTGINGATVLAASVTAEDAQQSNVFHSGIYFGVAASAAIAFVAELLRPVWRRDPPERRTVPAAQ